MGAASYNRGNRLISDQIDRDMSAPGVTQRAERQAYKDERQRLLARIAELEAWQTKARRSIASLRAMLDNERRLRAEEKEAREAERATDQRILSTARRMWQLRDRQWRWCSQMIRDLLTPEQVQAYRDDAEPS